MDKSSDEIERLNGIIHNKINELDQFRSNSAILETKLKSVNQATQKEFASYEEKMVGYGKEQERQAAQLKHRLTENEALKVKITELERTISRSEGMQQQNIDLKGQLNQMTRRVEEFKMKVSVL